MAAGILEGAGADEEMVKQDTPIDGIINVVVFDSCMYVCG